MTTMSAIQDQLPHNHCWGCGPQNAQGLHIKSYWQGDAAICTFRPQPYHAAGPTHVLNGGIIATLIDCHAVCTAIAAAYQAEGRPLGSEPLIWYVTGSLQVTYMHPTPLAAEVMLRARVVEQHGRKSRVLCQLFAGDQETVRGEVVAIRVPAAWRDPQAAGSGSH